MIGKDDIIKTGLQVETNTYQIREGNGLKFKKYGLKVMAEYMGIATGFPLTAGGFDQTGKTEFIFELLLQRSELYDQKHLLFTGEVGSVEDIYIDLYSKAGFKPYNKFDVYGNPQPHQTDKEAAKSKMFIDNHFFVVDTKNTPDLFRFDDLTKEIDKFAFANELDIQNFDTITIDPYYEISRENEPQTDQALQVLFGKIYRYGQKNKVDVIMTNHISKPEKYIDLSDGRKYPAMASSYQWAGGQKWKQKGFLLLGLYRPHPLGDYSEPPRPNELWVTVEKSKPKGLGKQGLFKLYYDAFCGRYYEIINGEAKFSRDWQKEESDLFKEHTKAMQPNEDFNNDKAPF